VILAPQFLAILAALAAPPDTPSSPAQASTFHPDPKWKALGPSLWFDPEGRRLVLRARVVLREGPLEHLLCLKGTKEHEAILATPAVPRQIHTVLLLTGAKEGHPVRFLPKFEPPAGTPIAIDLQWEQDGKTRRADAREWILDERNKSPLATDWVFAGSLFVNDPVTKERIYAADDGDLITVANFASSILDLPFASTANDADRSFVARTEQIPPVGTEVTLFLHPRRPNPTKPTPAPRGS
jgi:hypothetical protein